MSSWTHPAWYRGLIRWVNGIKRRRDNTREASSDDGVVEGADGEGRDTGCAGESGAGEDFANEDELVVAVVLADPASEELFRRFGAEVDPLVPESLADEAVALALDRLADEEVREVFVDDEVFDDFLARVEVGTHDPIAMRRMARASSSALCGTAEPAV